MLNDSGFVQRKKSVGKEKGTSGIYTTENALWLAGNPLVSLCPKRLASLAVIHGSV